MPVMIPVEVVQGLKVRFPTRSDDFRAGLEIGLLLAELACEPARISRAIAAANLPQVRIVLQGFGYRIIETRADGDMVEIECAGPHARIRPRLRVVSG